MDSISGSGHTSDMSSEPNHSRFDDAQAIAFGTVMTGFALTILTQMGLVTGQIAGIAALLSYVTGYGFGLLFFLLNLPFYWLGYRRRGLGFVVKTFISVALVSAIATLLPRWVGIALPDPAVGPWIGAVLYGFIAGAGLLGLFRHGASLGGVGIVALIIQDRFAFRAGYVQILVDICIFAVAFALFDPVRVFQSALGALILNAVIAINHRRDRYIA